MRYLPLLLCAALMAAAPGRPADAGIPGGVAIVLGFHVRAADDSLTLPLPPTPDDLHPEAPPAGDYDVWLFLHTREPLAGAWTLSLALGYDALTGQGVDVLSWQSFTDGFEPYPGWPAAGAGMFARWDRFKCQDPPRFMLPGRDGWWVQPVLRLRVRVNGPDRIGLADPEPGVPAQLIECADEMHTFDGDDSWSRFIPAVFGSGDRGGSVSGGGPPATTPAAITTWSAIKSRRGGE